MTIMVPDRHEGQESQIDAGNLKHQGASGFSGVLRWLLHKAQELAATSEVLLLGSVGQQPEMANADKTVRQDMQQEATDKLVHARASSI